MPFNKRSRYAFPIILFFTFPFSVALSSTPGVSRPESPVNIQEQVSVKHLSLSLGTKAQFEIPNQEMILNTVNSQEKIVLAKTLEGLVEVEAVGFGEATVTIYTNSSKVYIYRITVVPIGIQIPTPLVPDYVSRLGTRGSIGTRLGFRSQHGLFENLVQEEELLNYHVNGTDTSHHFQLRSIKPINYPEPKGARYAESLKYIMQTPHWALSVGDTTTQYANSSGSLRGARIDLLGEKNHSFLFSGIARSGVRNFLWGTEASAVVGLGEEYKWDRHWTTKAYALGFKKNPNILLKSDGVEMGAGISYSNGLLRELSGEVISDSSFHLNENANLLLDLTPYVPINISAFAGHTANQMEVYNLPSRFSEGYDTYGGAISGQIGESSITSPSASGIDWGASASRNLQMANQDEILGKADLQSYGLNLGLHWGAFHSSIFGTHYQTVFSPLQQGTLLSNNRDKGERIDWQNEYAIEQKNSITLNTVAGNTESQLALANYENEEIGAGLKHYFGYEKSNFLHLELGVTRFRFANLPVENGNYFLSRLSALIGKPKIRLDALIQNELRLTGNGNQDNLRLQLASVFQPHPRHEFSASIYNQFDWQRRIYSNFRGVYLQYLYHFGSTVADHSLWANLKHYTVRGKVKFENEEASKKELQGFNVVLLASETGQTYSVQTDEQGEYQFKDIAVGTYQLQLRGTNEKADVRLASANPRKIVVSERDLLDEDFIYSKSGSVAGFVFHDLNSNGKMDVTETTVEGISLQYRKEGTLDWQRIQVLDGQFELVNLSPGKWEFLLDAATLPPGYRADRLKLQKWELKPNGILNLIFPIEAERSISGMLFKDKNKNRVFDAGDEPIDNAVVIFQRAKTKTGEGGHFIFKHLKPSSGKVKYGTSESETIKLLEEPTQLHDIYVPVN